MTTNALSDFLKARRSRLTCAQVGLPERPGRRRVSGLRREEVAQLAAISVDYYARLEQGRIQPSPAVIASLARALQLDAGETAYLHEIAHMGQPARGPLAGWPSTPALTAVQELLDDLTLTPAFVIGPLTEVFAWNDLAARLFTDFSVIPRARRQYVRLLVADPAMRRLYADWADVTQLAVEQMRAQNAAAPDDPRLLELARELGNIDADFDLWWRTHAVAQRTNGVKVLHHPTVGELRLHWSALTWNADPRMQVITWQARDDQTTRRRLQLLAGQGV